MKILFLESYFKPEKTSGAHLAEDTREALVDAGHNIQIYAPTPSRGVSDEVRKEYKKRKKERERNGAISIRRFSLYREGKGTLGRAIRYVILEAKLLFFGLFAKDVDILPIGSTPPINGIMAVIIKKIRKIPFVYTVQDLFPDSLVSTKMTTEGSLLWKIGNWVSNVTYKNASHIVVISESIRKSLIERGVPKEKISVIYNWIDTEKTKNVKREENTLFDEFELERDKFYVTYAGNLGISQNVELMVECAELLKDNDGVRFVIFGDGSEKEKLVRRIEESGLENIRIFPMQPMDRVSEVYSLGDVSLVMCKAGVGKGAFPSKAASIMATETPVIASFDLDSDLCRTIDEYKSGECCEPENAEKVAEIISRLYTEKDLCVTYGENARRAACTKFSKEVNLAKKIKVFEENAKE